MNLHFGANHSDGMFVLQVFFSSAISSVFKMLI